MMMRFKTIVVTPNSKLSNTNFVEIDKRRKCPILTCFTKNTRSYHLIYCPL